MGAVEFGGDALKDAGKVVAGGGDEEQRAGGGQCGRVGGDLHAGVQRGQFRHNLGRVTGGAELGGPVFERGVEEHTVAVAGDDMGEPNTDAARADDADGGAL